MANIDKVRDAYEKSVTRSQAERYSYERDWFRNALYYCLSGETLIPLLDGSIRPINSLVGLDPIWVYGFDPDSLRIVPALMSKVWPTGEKPCVTVHLDNGHSFTCTDDHKILTWFGYQEAGSLIPGVPLVPFRSKFFRATGNGSKGGYNQVFQPYDAAWEQTHRMVAKSINGESQDKFVVHHVNEIKTDNRPENLQPMLLSDHSTLTLERHKEKIVTAVREWKRRPANRKAAAERAKNQWANQREMMLQANHSFRENSEYLENLREKVKAFWSDPEKKAKRIGEMRAYWDKKKSAVNCRVVAVEPAGVQDVFDASVPATNNFAIESGVFVHNCGIQWVLYNSATRKWKPRKIAKWVPRPVTNKFYSIANTIMQVLSSKQPDVRARPGTDSPEDIAAASVGDKILSVILDEANADEARWMASAWMVLTGTAVSHACYDNDAQHGTTFVQHLRCKKCGETFAPDMAGPAKPLASALGTPLARPASDMRPVPGSNGGMQGASPMPLPLGAPPEMPEEPQQEMSEVSCPKCGFPMVDAATEPDGTQVGEDLPIGKCRIEVFSPFEVFLDLESRSMAEVQRILTRRRYPLDVIQRKFNRFDLEGDNNSNTGGAIGLNLLRAIAYAAGSSIYGSGIASGRNLGDDQNITVDQLWVRPCNDFPEGLVAFFSNDQLLNEDTVGDGIPYHDSQGNPLWPWYLHQFDRVPGRIFGKTPMDDVAPKQEQRNKLESLIQLIITRCAAPHWLIPKGIGITEITGEPGQLLEGNWAMDPRLKPERIPGENVPTSLIAWLEKIDKDMEDIAGVYDVLRGNAPPGVTAGTALRLLLERATTRFTPTSLRFEKDWGKICTDLLCIFQEYAGEARMSRIQGPGNTWEIQRFSKADIKGSVDVVVEAGSSVPKSLVGEQAMIQDFTSMGIINPQMPETQYKILESFGSTKYLGDVDLNIRYAQRENWHFINEDMEPNLNPIIDSHAVHLMVHKQYALTSDFEILPEQKRAMWLNHITEHMMAMMPPPLPATPGDQPPTSGPAESAGPPPANSEKPQSKGQPTQGNDQPPMPGGPM